LNSKLYSIRKLKMNSIKLKSKKLKRVMLRSQLYLGKSQSHQIQPLIRDLIWKKEIRIKSILGKLKSTKHGKNSKRN